VEKVAALSLQVGVAASDDPLLLAVVMPLWLSAVGFPMAPPFPNIGFPDTVMSLIGHIIYAIPVALAYVFMTSD
jgi:hypothetical protein